MQDLSLVQLQSQQGTALQKQFIATGTNLTAPVPVVVAVTALDCNCARGTQSCNLKTFFCLLNSLFPVSSFELSVVNSKKSYCNDLHDIYSSIYLT